MYAFDNLFTGEIPLSIWNVDSLEWLHLKNNNMTGTVPDSFCNYMSKLKLDDTSWFIDSPKGEPQNPICDVIDICGNTIFFQIIQDDGFSTISCKQ